MREYILATFCYLIICSWSPNPPVRAQFRQEPVLPARAVDLANQQLKCAERFLLQNDVVLARHISAVDLRDQWLRGVGTGPCPDWARIGDPRCS
ncbi:hypothetical protein RHMOL_Rhmol07G0036100 [Rhododendron molle]|uniref:Uncharacterized protein n=1 Tax=Rhododendron molle TaxID=49168 RepID=A0ACC0MWH4_RHOML|nr:hypothetical protein RHMOL_Rhmol07G0036100 [Rhododendron molle]